MQTDSRVGRRRALQKLARQYESQRSNHHSYPPHFRCKMDPESKGKIKTFAI